MNDKKHKRRPWYTAVLAIYIAAWVFLGRATGYRLLVYELFKWIAGIALLVLAIYLARSLS